MATSRLLSLKHTVAKSLTSKPTRWVSAKDRLDSTLSRTFCPNTDEMRRVFNVLDADGDGKISRKELTRSLESLRPGEDTRDEVRRMMEVMDLNGDGYIDFKEFMDVHMKGGGIKAGDIQRAFWIIDLDEDGRIGAEDLHGIMKMLGERISKRECERIVKDVDTDGDGLVDMDDFMAMMTRTMEVVHV